MVKLFHATLFDTETNISEISQPNSFPAHINSPYTQYSTVVDCPPYTVPLQVLRNAYGTGTGTSLECNRTVPYHTEFNYRYTNTTHRIAFSRIVPNRYYNVPPYQEEPYNTHNGTIHNIATHDHNVHDKMPSCTHTIPYPTKANSYGSDTKQVHINDYIPHQYRNRYIAYITRGFNTYIIQVLNRSRTVPNGHNTEGNHASIEPKITELRGRPTTSRIIPFIQLRPDPQNMHIFVCTILPFGIWSRWVW